MYIFQNETWSARLSFQGTEIHELAERGDVLTLVDDRGANVIGSSFLWSGNCRAIIHVRPMWMTREILCGGFRGGLVTGEEGDSWSLMPNGPTSTNVMDMAAAGNMLYTVQGGPDVSWANLYHPAILGIFGDNRWKSKMDPDARDPFTLAVDPGNPSHVFSGSWGYGLLEFRDNQTITRYTAENSTLQSLIAGGDFIRIGGTAFDAEGNLWMTNTGGESHFGTKSRRDLEELPAGGKLSDFSALHSIVAT
ncbi:MAG: hypothetical protein R2751_09370 [Bacteroidales bacterium]